MTRITVISVIFALPMHRRAHIGANPLSGDLQVLGQAARENLDSRQSPERFRRPCSGGNIVGRTGCHFSGTWRSGDYGPRPVGRSPRLTGTIEGQGFRPTFSEAVENQVPWGWCRRSTATH